MSSIDSPPIAITMGDALVVVDMQNDFLPGGSLAVPGGEQTIPLINAYIAKFQRRSLPIFATRDWHPADHCSFTTHGGPWPEHCVAGSKGAEFSPAIRLPEDAEIISTGYDNSNYGYSGFEGTKLHDMLARANVKRLFVCGLATDYCVLNTVRDALTLGYRVWLLHDAIRAVNVHPRDGENAEREMRAQGAEMLTLERLA